MSRSLKRVGSFFSHSLGILLNFLRKDYRCHHCDRAGGNHSEEHRPSCCQGFLDTMTVSQPPCCWLHVPPRRVSAASALHCHCS